MSEGTRPACYSIPTERVLCLLWLKGTYPTGWQALWQRITKAWRS